MVKLVGFVEAGVWREAVEIPVEDQEEFPVRIRIWVRNQRSMFARVATVIAEQGCNILDVDVAESTEEYQPIDMIIEVNDRVHLAQVLKHLRHESDVQKVQRHKG